MKKLLLNKQNPKTTNQSNFKFRTLLIAFLFSTGLLVQGQTFTMSTVGADDSASTGFKTITSNPTGANIIITNNMQLGPNNGLSPIGFIPNGVDYVFTIKADDIGADTFDLDDMMWANSGNNAQLNVDTKIVFKDINGSTLDTWTLAAPLILVNGVAQSILTIFTKGSGIANVAEMEITIDYGTIFNPVIFEVRSITMSNFTLDVMDNDLTSLTTIYPNPTTGNLNIQLDQNYQSVKVNITNILGQTVSSFERESTNKIDFKLEEKEGIYFIDVLTDTNKKMLFKVLKR